MPRQFIFFASTPKSSRIHTMPRMFFAKTCARLQACQTARTGDCRRIVMRGASKVTFQQPDAAILSTHFTSIRDHLARQFPSSNGVDVRHSERMPGRAEAISRICCFSTYREAGPKSIGPASCRLVLARTGASEEQLERELNDSSGIRAANPSKRPVSNGCVWVTEVYLVKCIKEFRPEL